MKIALYIEDGLEQIVLTPDGEVEKNILAKLNDGPRELSVKHGSLYECQGGWVRQGSNADATLIILRKRVPGPSPSETEEISE